MIFENYEEVKFLKESNKIEGEFSREALEDAMKAWNYAKTVKVIRSPNKILTIHKILMMRLRPDIAGRFRWCAVSIGGEIKERPQKNELYRMMLDWISKHANAKTEAKIKKAHIAFEKMHPFEDGNGRTGRIIMNMQRLNAGLPLLIICVGKEQESYYKWFQCD